MILFFNNGVDPGSPLILILKVVIIQQAFSFTQSMIGSGLSSIITKNWFLGLRRQIRGVINTGIYVIPYLLFNSDVFDMVKPHGS